MVSSSRDFYNIIQYGEILEAVGDAIQRHGDQHLDPSGQVALSPTAHKMSATIDLDGNTAYAADNDPIDVGLKVRSGHSGFHGVKHDVGTADLQ